MIGFSDLQADLAAALRHMADEERAARARGADRLAGLEAARDAFYRGDIARTMVAHQKAEGGWLSADDLANFRSRIEPVVRRGWRGHELSACGAWCQGPALQQGYWQALSQRPASEPSGPP